MPLHFSSNEFDQRLHKIQQKLQEHQLDGLLLFAPESHYYLTGYDTFGFAMFQCMVIPQTGKPHLLTRAPDLRQALHTSTLSSDQIRIWQDKEGTNPYQQLLELLSALGLAGARLGIETNTVGLTAWQWQQLSHTFESTPPKRQPELVEASDLVPELRRVKSAAEIDFIREAAKLSDAALDAALTVTEANAFEGDILAAMQGRVFEGGGDYAGNEFIVGSGDGALMCRYYSGRRKLDDQDQLTLEWSGAYRRYHAAMMRTIIIGAPSTRQQAMHAAAVEALCACEAAIKPGEPMGSVFEAHARTLDAHGMSHARLNACGYGMGAVYNPIWVEFPMFYENNPLLMEAGNVFFLHMILMDSDAGLAMCWGHSVLVTETGVERLSRHSLDLLQC